MLATADAPLLAAWARLSRPIAVPIRVIPAAAKGPPAQVATPAARPMASAVMTGYRPGLRASHQRAACQLAASAETQRRTLGCAVGVWVGVTGKLLSLE